MGEGSRPAPTSGPRQGSTVTGLGLVGALTAKVGGPPVQGLPPCVGALAGVLGHGVADAAGQVGEMAQAEVLLAGLHVAGGVHQGVAAPEGVAAQELLTDALGPSQRPC